MPKPVVAVLSFSDLHRDPRVRRQLEALRHDHQAVAIGCTDPNIAGVAFRPVPGRDFRSLRRAFVRLGLSFLQQYERMYWSLPAVRAAGAILRELSPDAIVANDILALPVSLRSGAPVVYDAHEYAPRQAEELLQFRLLLKGLYTDLCRRYIPRVQAMTTVSEGIAQQYESDTGVRAVLLTNAPPYADLDPAPVSDRRIRLVHHGSASPARRLESMIEMVRHLDSRFDLTLMLVGGSRRYRRKLQRLAGEVGRVHFADPVPVEQIASRLNAFDVGVYILEPVNFNHAHALPNKIFEFIQARLAVAIGPSPEMARLVHETGCGVVASDFSAPSLAAQLNALTEADIKRFKKAANQAAPRLCSESNAQLIRSLVADALSAAS